MWVRISLALLIFWSDIGLVIGGLDTITCALDTLESPELVLTFWWILFKWFDGEDVIFEKLDGEDATCDSEEVTFVNCDGEDATWDGEEVTFENCDGEDNIFENWDGDGISFEHWDGDGDVACKNPDCVDVTCDELRTVVYSEQIWLGELQIVVKHCLEAG